MRIEVDKLQLFLVDIGIPSYKSYPYFDDKTLFIMANNYNEVVEKATLYIEQMSNKKSIIDESGSLNLSDEPALIKSIKLACEKIIW